MLPERMKQLKDDYKESLITEDHFKRLKIMKTVEEEYGFTSLIALIAQVAKEITEESN